MERREGGKDIVVKAKKEGKAETGRSAVELGDVLLKRSREEGDIGGGFGRR